MINKHPFLSAYFLGASISILNAHSSTQEIQENGTEVSEMQESPFSNFEFLSQIVERAVHGKEHEWAQKVVKYLADIKKDAIHFGKNNQDSISFLSFVDFLCHYCQEDLKMIAAHDFAKADLHIIVYSVPLFQGDLSPQYGLILGAAYRQNPEAFSELLKSYSQEKPSTKETLLKKVEEFSIKIQETDYKDLSAYNKHAKMLTDLGLTQVPVSFALIPDGSNAPIILPLPIRKDLETLKQIKKELLALTAEQRVKLRKLLGQ